MCFAELMQERVEDVKGWCECMCAFMCVCAVVLRINIVLEHETEG